MPMEKRTAFIQAVYQRGFNEGRDQALKAMVQICDGLVTGFNAEVSQ
ncbi:hypothetical protein [Dehalogenimonas alkenigignens]|nr:hypothetical protein [Dehalogenimonas alkenigignens]